MGQVSREAATHSQMIMAAAHAAAAICRPSRAPGVGIPVLGLTPQAMSLSRLRRSYRSIHSPSREAATDIYPAYLTGFRGEGSEAQVSAGFVVNWATQS